MDLLAVLFPARSSAIEDMQMDQRYRLFHYQRWDPRLYQIAVLTGLLVYGIGWLHFHIPGIHAAAILVTVLLTQYACTYLWRLPVYDPRSALISGLSLCLLLRTNSLLLAVIAAVVTIMSKFVLRWNDKHIFNPTNFGLVALMLCTDQIWVSPGQWGHTAFLGFLLACLGGFVVNRALRNDVTYAFFGFYLILLCSRALWLGDPLRIPLHHLQNGAFLVFTFFMISDPKTTPNARSGRVLFAFLVAIGAVVLQFGFYWTNGLLWSLVFFAMTVPLIDWLLPGAHYDWKQAIITSTDLEKGELYATDRVVRHDLS